MSPESEHWSFLERKSDACAVVSASMEVVYLNAPARSLVPPDWSGKRCWQVFPVSDQNCAARCPAVCAVNDSNDFAYCEETICCPTTCNERVELGVVVIPLPVPPGGKKRAILLMRPKPGEEHAHFRKQLIDDARQLRKLGIISSS